MNLNSPFFKMDIDKVFVVYAVTDTRHLLDYTESPYGWEYRCTYKQFINISNSKKIVYFDGEKYFDIIHGDEVKVSSPAVSSDSYTIITNNNDSKIVNNYYGYPVSIKEYFKAELGSNIPKEVSVRKVLSLYNKMKLNDKKDDSILLSNNPNKASKQIKKFCNYTVSNGIYTDDKVSEILDKIDELFESDSAFSLKAKKKTDELIEKYNNSLKENKPHFSTNNSSVLKFEALDPYTQLVTDLERLYYSYSTQLETIKSINELEACRVLLENGKDNTLINGNIIDSVREANNNLKYLSLLDQSSRKNALINIISGEITKLNKSLNIEDDKQLVLNDKISCETQIKSVVDDINNSARINKPFVDLKDAFLSEKYEYVDGNNISDVITSIKYIIDNIDNKTLESELRNEFNSIKDKYTVMLNKIIESYKTLDFESLELNLRKELEPFLQKLDFSSNKKLNQIISVSSLNIQIDKSLFIINKSDYNNEAYKSLNEPITSSVIELLKMSEELEDKSVIKETIIEALNNNKAMLSDVHINNYEEYNKYRNEVLKSLMSIKLDIMGYKDKLNKYNKNIKI